MPDEPATQIPETATDPTITEDCQTCHGTGRRFRASAANPGGGEDLGACPVCHGTGKVVALGVVHTPPGAAANVEKIDPSASKTEPVATVTVPTPTATPATPTDTPDMTGVSSIDWQPK